MQWRTGNWTSMNDTVPAFLECGDDGWWVRPIDDEGEVLWEEAAHPSPFPSVEQAQHWAEANLPHRS